MTQSYTCTFAEIAQRPVAVIGAGTLGRRIALMFAGRGGRVQLYARRADQLADASDYVAATLPAMVQGRGLGDVGELITTTTLADAVRDAWLVVESVPERLEIKIPLWEQIDRLAEPDAIFATNSSSFPSRLMADGVRDKRRLCNMHFAMPPDYNAVELMSDGETDRALLDSLLAILPEFGVVPFEARRESTGFIFNRIWAAIKRESLAVVADGVARPEDVDGMFKVNWGMPIGPFGLMDKVGLDVVLDIENNYAREFPHLPIQVRELLQTYVDAGKLGVKTGEGFYRY